MQLFALVTQTVSRKLGEFHCIMYMIIDKTALLLIVAT